MRSITLSGVLAVGALFAGVASVSAQSPAPLETAYAHVNFGGQGGSHDLVQSGAFPLYDENALVTSKTGIGGGGVFDIGGGYRVWSQVYAGLSYSYTSDSSNADVTGSIPHPLRYDEFRAVTGNANGLKHKESALHLQAVWRQPVTTKFDVALSIGPTIYFASQDVVKGLTIAEQPNGVVLTGVETESVNDTTVGFNIGADGTYLFSPRFGAGAFLRYAGGEASLDGTAGTVKLDLGGVQIGAGLRLRF